MDRARQHFPIFLKVGKELSPQVDRCYRVDRKLMKQIAKLPLQGPRTGDITNLHVPFMSFGIELDQVVMHYWVDQNNILFIDVWDQQGKHRERHNPQQILDRVNQGWAVESFQQAIALLTTNFLLYVNQQKLPRRDRAKTKIKPTLVMARRGDSTRYSVFRADKEKRFMTRTPVLEKAAMRDHAVRGHWRKLADGREIWVKPHRRGDASLGTVTTHHLVETN